MCVQKTLEISGKNMAINIPLQRKRKQDDSIAKSGFSRDINERAKK